MELEYVYDDGGWCGGYVAKGWVDFDELAEEIEKQYGHDIAIDQPGLVKEHTIMRKIPTPWHDEWDFIFEYSNPGRGAFKCTAIWL